MQLKAQALYNLVRFTSHYNPSIKVKKWQVEDLRDLNEGKLFKKLLKLGLNLDKEVFLKYAQEIETPEELIEVLAAELKCDLKDQIYLILFELYRRFFSERRCLSIFCDELDHQIFLYDTNDIVNDEMLQDALAHLKVILDNNVDLGLSPKDAFQNLLKYLAHDLENFLFDYISDQIECKNESYAFDLIDGFYSYVTMKSWFDFLKAKLKAMVDIVSSNKIIAGVLENLKTKPNLELQLRILKFMVDIGDRNLFLKIVKQTAPHLQKEEEFKRILNIVADFYYRLDKEDMEKKMLKLMAKRSKVKNENTLKKQDVNEFLQILV